MGEKNAPEIQDKMRKQQHNQYEKKGQTTGWQGRVILEKG
jgi:hypothetical protein